MKKKSYSVMELVQKAIIDSMNYSREDGNQIFVYVSPHVNSVQLYAYHGRWNVFKERSFDVCIYTHGSLAPTIEEAKKILKPVYDFIKQNPQ